MSKLQLNITKIAHDIKSSAETAFLQGENWQQLMYCNASQEDFEFIHAPPFEYRLLYGRITAVIALFIYLYILFCFFYRKKEQSDLPQDYYVILSISVVILISCLVKTVGETVRLFKDEFLPENEILFSVLISFRVYFDRDILYFLLVLLSFYRFYGLCKPLKNYVQTFSLLRTFTYCLVYVLIGLCYVAFKEAVICGRLFKNRLIQNLGSMLIFAVHNIYFISSIIIIGRLHCLSIIKLQRDISEEENLIEWSKRRQNDMPRISFSDESWPICEQYNVKRWRKYLNAIHWFMFMVLALLVIDYITWLLTRWKVLATGSYFGREKFPGLEVCRLVCVNLTDTLLQLQFLVLTRTNEQFRLTLLKPLKDLKRSVLVIWKGKRKRRYKKIEEEPNVFVTRIRHSFRQQ